MRTGVKLATILGRGGIDLDAFMAAQSDGFYFDTTKTDRFFQENNGPTLADDVGEAVGLAFDQRTWGGLTLAQVIAAQSEIVINGGFSADANWTKDAGWTISGGRLNANAAAFTLASQSGVVGLVAETLYRVEYEITSYTSGGVRLRFEGGTAVVGTSRTAAGVYVEYLMAVSGNNQFVLQALGSGFVGSIDNVSVKAIPGKHGIQATGSLKPIRQTTGAKFDGSDDNWLTRYYPDGTNNFLVSRVTVPAAIAATQIVAGSFNGTTQRFWVGFNPSGLCVAGVGSDSATTILGTTDCRGQEVVVGVTCDGTSLRLLVNNAQEFAAARNGSIPTSVPMRVGSQNNNGSAGNFFGGSVKKLVAGREFLTLSRYLQIRNSLLAA